MKLKKSVKVCLLIIVIVLCYFLINDLKKDKNEVLDIITTKTSKNNKDLSANITVVGDFLFEQPYYDSLSNGDNRDDYFSLIKDFFAKDDLSIGNMEVVIGNSNLEVSGIGYSFCAPEEIGNQVASLDMEVLSTANNHSNDRGQDGIVSQIDFFKNNTDIVTVGTYKSKEDRNNIRVVNINGIKFSFLAYTYGTNISYNDNDYGIGLYKLDGKLNKELIKEEVNKAKETGDVCVVIMHWGLEFTSIQNDEQKKLAEYLNSLGVDIIVGSHSHSIQPIDIIGEDKKTLVYYSLGNFVSADYDISRTGEKYDNAYQFGLMSNFNVSLHDNNVLFTNIKTIPIINYYDESLRHFKLIPFNLYNDTYEKSHYRYKYNFNKEFINNMFNEVINEKYR